MFLGWASNALSTSQNFKQKYEDEQTARADEVAGLTLEHETAPRALGSQGDEPVGEPALAAHRARSGDAPHEEAAIAGGLADLHDDEPTVGQLRLAV